MKKLVLLAAVVAALSMPSVFAEDSCPSGGCGGKKDKDSSKDTEKQTLTVEVAL